MLSIVPTPIGNTQDITLRTLELFRNVDYIISENTHTSKKLLGIYDIDTSQKTFVKFTSHDTYRIEHILEDLTTKDALLVSEAGTPALSDPGKLLIQTAQDAWIPITILPGANALIPAVIMSNFPTTHRSFYGFLPHKKWRMTLLQDMIASDRPSFFYESVHRISKLVEQLSELNYIGKISIAREISKLHEQFVTYDLPSIQASLQDGSLPQRGEFVIGLYPL